MHVVNTVDNSTYNSHAVIVSGHQFLAHTGLPAPRIAIQNFLLTAHSPFEAKYSPVQ